MFILSMLFFVFCVALLLGVVLSFNVVFGFFGGIFLLPMFFSVPMIPVLLLPIGL